MNLDQSSFIVDRERTSCWIKKKHAISIDKYFIMTEDQLDYFLSENFDTIVKIFWLCLDFFEGLGRIGFFQNNSWLMSVVSLLKLVIRLMLRGLSKTEDENETEDEEDDSEEENEDESEGEEEDGNET
jgi:hypothetical protein